MAMALMGETVHFSIRYEGTSTDAFAIAQAILGVCESNFNTVSALLTIPPDEKTPGGLPPFTGLMPILVEVLPTPPGALGRNFGYSKTVRSRIQVSMALTPEAGKQVFVTELSEILMGFHRWNASDSQGEALSEIFRDELYTTPFDVRVNSWLNVGPARPNFVGKANPTDSEPISYGCGILFINYLRYQLGRPMHAICEAHGTTLTERYQALTGNTDDGFTKFRDLLEKHLPVSPGNYSLPTDNPFPMYEDPSMRSIIPSAQRHTFTKSPPVVFLPHGKVNVRPFFTCPKKEYSYELAAHKDTAQIEVQAIGFAQPVFQWRIGPESLPSVTGTNSTSGSSSLTADLDAPDPAAPGEPKRMSAPLTVDYSISNRFTTNSMSSTIELSNADFAGTYSFDVEVTVTEKETDVGSNSLPMRVKLKTLEVAYQPEFYADQTRCSSKFDRALIGPVLKHKLELVKGLPDPPPPDSRGVIVEAALAAHADIVKARERDHDAAKALVRYVSSILQVRPSVFEHSLETHERERT